MVSKTFDTAARRWEGVGPYYAMFPTRFTDDVVRRFTRPGDAVIDPFAGRGTAVFSAAHQGRSGYGIEICSVGWVYAATKIRPATKQRVLRRLADILSITTTYRGAAHALPEFFHWCYSPSVAQFLVAAREQLRWRTSRVDRTLMAFLLVYLHGKRDAALSNQMRQTKSMAPKYAVRWWKDRGLQLPEIDVAQFLRKRIAWRYKMGRPVVSRSRSYLGESSQVLRRVASHVARSHPAGIRLLLTSPPYFRVTNYHYDQWLRLWLLGGPPTDSRAANGDRARAKFEHPEHYVEMLYEVFAGSAQLLGDDAVVYVRTGVAKETLSPTLTALHDAFPGLQIERRPQPYKRPTQTRLFGDGGGSSGEIDLVFRLRSSQPLSTSTSRYNELEWTNG